MRKTVLALALWSSAAVAQGPADAPRLPSPPAASPAPSASTAPPASTAAPPAREPVPRGTVLEEVSGKVAEIDRTAHRMRVDTASGPVTLSLDRNTMVYTASGLGTVLDVTPGVQVRAGRNADFLAYWVQVRVPASTPSTPGQGTGPAGGGSAPATEGSGPGTGPAPSPPSTGPAPIGPGPIGGGRPQ